MLTESRFMQDVDVAAVIVHALDRHHSTGAVRHRPSGRDPCRRAMRERAGRRTTSRDAVGDGEPPRRLRRANGESIHGGTRKGRQVHDSACRLAQNTSKRLRDQHTLDREKPRPLENVLERLVNR